MYKTRQNIACETNCHSKVHFGDWQRVTPTFELRRRQVGLPGGSLSSGKRAAMRPLYASADTSCAPGLGKGIATLSDCSSLRQASVADCPPVDLSHSLVAHGRCQSEQATRK